MAEESAAQASSGPVPAGAAGSGRSAPARRLDWAVGGAVLLVCAVAQLAFLLGPHPFDPAKYFESAVSFPHIPIDLWTLRIGLVGLVYVPVLVLGPSEVAFYAVPFATGLLLAGSVYGTMLVLFRDRVLAAGAALVTVLNAAYLLNASSIFPDTTATATFAAGFFCLVLGGYGFGEAERTRRLDVAAATAGVLFGLTYLIREFSPILVPAVAVGVVLLRYPTRRTLLLGAAAVATAGLELLYGALRSGNPFLHAARLLDRTGAGDGRGNRVEVIQSQLDGPFQTLLVLPRLLVSWRSGWLLVLLLLLFVVALALTRDRRLWLVAGWCFGFWVVMAAIGLGSLPSGKWILNITNPRYWTPILPPLAMGAFGGLALLGARFLPPRVGAVRLVPAVAAVLALVTIVPALAEFRSCADRGGWRNEPRGRWVDLRDWFASPEADRYGALWTDWRTHRLLPAYTSTTFGRELWGGSIHAFLGLDADPVPPDARTHAVILVHKDHLRRDVDGSAKGLASLRGEWAPIFTSGDGNMVVLARRPPAEADPGRWWLLAAGPTDPVEPGTCGLTPYERRGA